MAKPLFRWNIYLVQAKGRWLGEIEAGTQFERELILSRTREGRVRAKANGVKFGRKSVAPAEALVR
jgi:DNA invertase Pin-like site-specific DNA recombinase